MYQTKTPYTMKNKSNVYIDMNGPCVGQTESTPKFYVENSESCVQNYYGNAEEVLKTTKSIGQSSNR